MSGVVCSAAMLALVLPLPPHTQLPARYGGAHHVQRIARRSEPCRCDVTRERAEWARRQRGPPRPGTVLVATPGSFDHYFMDSLVLVLDHDDEKGTSGSASVWRVASR